MLSCIQTHAQRYVCRTTRISFSAGTDVEKIEPFSNEGACVFDVGSGLLTLQVLVRSFKFEKALMQDHFNENYLESNKFPKAIFKGKVTNLNDIHFEKQGTYPADIEGELTLHGVTKQLNLPVYISVGAGRIAAHADFEIIPKEYDVDIPSVVSNKILNKLPVKVHAELKPVNKK